MRREDGYMQGMLNPELALNRRLVDRVARNALLASLARRWQPVVQKVLARAGPQVSDILHGVPLGHSVHAVATDIPLGAWTAAVALDALALCGFRDLEPGADATIAVGLVGVAAAAASGWAEWSDTKDHPRTLGMGHALLAATSTAAYAASFTLRRAKRRPAALLLSAAGYAIALGTAYFGGELSLGMQLGVKHTGVPKAPPSDFTPVGRIDDFEDGVTEERTVNGLQVVFLRRGRSVVAFGAACTHRGASLAGRSVSGDLVTCPWHASRFDVNSGAVSCGPATFPLPTYDVRVVDGAVEMRGGAGASR